MDHRTATSLIAVSAAAMLLTGCTDGGRPTAAAAAAAAGASASPSSSSSPGAGATYGPLEEQTVALTCTEIGNAEGVGVDLTTALPQEGGDYFATVSVPSLGVSETTGFAGDDWHHPGGRVQADLTAAPVTVVVSFADESGRELYRAGGTGTPELFQPNGSECDGENYRISLVATPDHHLRPRRGDEWVVKDARGRWSDSISTSCGVWELTDGSVRSDQPVVYTRVGGPLVGPDGGAPAGWNLPDQRGWVSKDGDRLRFEDERGHSEVFERAPADHEYGSCPSGSSS